jgi:hypothetical protein
MVAYCFRLCLSFFMRRGGGSEAPTRRMVRWGLHVKFTQPLSSFYQTLNPRECC